MAQHSTPVRLKRRPKRQKLGHWLGRRWLLPVGSFLLGCGMAVMIGMLEYSSQSVASPEPGAAVAPINRPADQGESVSSPNMAMLSAQSGGGDLTTASGRPQLNPLPAPQEVWQCEVVVVGGSLGGVSAASYAMESGARTCLIELTPWLGGQLSSQGVSAIDQSLDMIQMGNFSDSWIAFKDSIRRQPVELPQWDAWVGQRTVSETSSCWVGNLCFPPKAGAVASEQWLQQSKQFSPESRWVTSTAFKGAEFDPSGRQISAIYAVRRIPRRDNYLPQGRPSVELTSWYAWEADDTFEKVPMRLEPLPGRRMIVIDATDTGELVAWARVPYKVGSDSRSETGEINAAARGNPECTQAFTFPFTLAIRDDGGKSQAALDAAIAPFYPQHEHINVFSLEGTPMFSGKSFFNYRRIVSTDRNSAFNDSPDRGDIAMINWTQGNDWNWMNPPLILTPDKLEETGQHQNWMGGLSLRALRHAENHALLFADWLLENHQDPNYPLIYLAGVDSPMNTVSGLSMLPYFREGRRILGRNAYGQPAFMMRESDVRNDMPGRNFEPTAIAVTHYDIDIHGCRYRNWEPTGEATNASVKDHLVRPVKIPLEALIPQGVDNLLIGGKTIAVTHIVNAVTRLHHGEWSIGAAAGGTAGWLVQNPQLTPAQIVPQNKMPELHEQLRSLGKRLEW